MIALRREFHKFAEATWLEFRTTAKIAKELIDLNFDIRVGEEIIENTYAFGRPIASIIDENIERAKTQGADKEILERMGRFTGVLGVIEGKYEGKTILLRFDIDANQIKESGMPNHLPTVEGFSSVNKGIMHACGHDGHIAIGLTIAKYLSELTGEFRGKVILLFQPAEEGVSGARAVLAKGVIEKVDYFFSSHIGLKLEKGQFAAGTSGFLATKKLDVTYIGKAAHSGMAPNEGNNALLAAATATLNLHAIAPHNKGTSRVNVGTLKAGDARNVIAPKAFMEIETRGETKEINEYVYARALKILKASAQMYEVKCEISNMGEADTCICDSEAVDIVCKVAEKLNCFKEIIRDYYLGVSEDVSLIINEVQKNGGIATFMVFGTEIKGGHHNCLFDFEEEILKDAFEVYKNILIEITSVK